MLVVVIRLLKLLKLEMLVVVCFWVSVIVGVVVVFLVLVLDEV